MTACVNKKSKRVAAVVTASLVGALSIGAPAVALATGSDISMQSVGALGGGTLTAAQDGQYGDIEDLKGTIKLEAGSGKFVVPTEVTDVAGNKLDVTDTDAYTVEYERYTDTKTWPVNPGEGKTYADFFATAGKTNAGFTYRVIITNKQDTSDKKEISFKYVDSSEATKLTAVEDNDADDTTFTYNGKPQKVTFVDQNGDEFPTSEGEVLFYDTVGNKVDGNGKTAPTKAGSYVATVTKGGKTYNVPFAVEKLDLSKAFISVADVKTTEAPDSTAALLKLVNIAGVATDDKAEDGIDTKAGDFVVVSKFSNPNGGSNVTKTAGKYEFELAAKPTDKGEENPNITGTAKVNYWVIDGTVEGFAARYGSASSASINLSDGESFDASKINLYKEATYDVIKGDKLEITYVNGDGEKVDASELAKAGDYTASIRVVPFQNDKDQWIGGNFSLTIKVSKTGLNADNVLSFVYDGKVVSGNLGVVYSGEDFLKEISTTFKDSEGNVLEAGKDYKVKVTNDKTKKEVESIVDAGDYIVTVEGINYTVSGVNTLGVSVAEKNFGDLKDYKENADKAKDESLAYTGAKIDVPALLAQKLKADNATGVVDEDKNPVYAEVPAALYKVTNIKYSADGTSFKTVDSIKEAGSYTVTVKLTDDADKNYQMKDNTFTVDVTKKKSFTDVDPTEWYAAPIYKAQALQYVNGLSGTTLFAPTADITRADAVCILFNMASGKIGADIDYGYSELKGYVTGFNDVDGKAYFAKAIAWANAVDVANGSNGSFRPYDKITREEFASLLANFAKVKGDYAAVDADEVLGSATDYSAWAKENVAWAKANGIMGNNGAAIDGTGNITRAQVAAMAVNYQPEKLPAVSEK